jgi:ATP-dependent DNA ligase
MSGSLLRLLPVALTAPVSSLDGATRLDSCSRRYYYPFMSLRERADPGLDLIKPCLPLPAKRPPTGPNWIHEIKHDGFRIMARRDATGVRLITRNGNDLTNRLPGIVSKRLGSSYRSGRSKHWVKVKNPKAPAVKREAEEDRGSKGWGRR